MSFIIPSMPTTYCGPNFNQVAEYFEPYNLIIAPEGGSNLKVFFKLHPTLVNDAQIFANAPFGEDYLLQIYSVRYANNDNRTLPILDKLIYTQRLTRYKLTNTVNPRDGWFSLKNENNIIGASINVKNPVTQKDIFVPGTLYIASLRSVGSCPASPSLIGYGKPSYNLIEQWRATTPTVTNVRISLISENTIRVSWDYPQEYDYSLVDRLVNTNGLTGLRLRIGLSIDNKAVFTYDTIPAINASTGVPNKFIDIPTNIGPTNGYVIQARVRSLFYPKFNIGVGAANTIPYIKSISTTYNPQTLAADGRSINSQFTNSTLLSIGGEPKPPTNFRVNITSSWSRPVVMSWNHALGGGDGVITNYQIQYAWGQNPTEQDWKNMYNDQPINGIRLDVNYPNNLFIIPMQLVRFGGAGHMLEIRHMAKNPVSVTSGLPSSGYSFRIRTINSNRKVSAWSAPVAVNKDLPTI